MKRMDKELYEYVEISDLKDMLNKTKKIYEDKTAYKLRGEKPGTFNIVTHKEVREMVDSLGTVLINLGLKGKRIAIIGENRYEWEIAYLAVVCGTGIVAPMDKSLPENELKNLIERSGVEAIIYSGKYEEEIKRIKEEGMKKVLKELEEALKRTIMHKKIKRNVSYEHLIKLELYKLIKHLLEEQEYQGFKIWW